MTAAPMDANALVRALADAVLLGRKRPADADAALAALASGHPDHGLPQALRLVLRVGAGEQVQADAWPAAAQLEGLPAGALAFWQSLGAAGIGDEALLCERLSAHLADMPGDPLAAVLLGELLRRRRQRDMADSVLEDALRANPSAALCWEVRRRSGGRLRDPGLAQALAQPAVAAAELTGANDLMLQLDVLTRQGRLADARALVLETDRLWMSKATVSWRAAELGWEGEALDRFIALLVSGARAGGDVQRQGAVLALVSLGQDTLARKLLRHGGTAEDLQMAAAVKRLPQIGGQGAAPVFGSGGHAVVPSPGARKCLVLFAGMGDRVGLPVPVMNRLLAQLPVHRIFVRDQRRDLYLSGIEGLGATQAESVAALRRVIADLGAQEIYTLGNSSGGHAALRYAAALEARQAMGSGSPTNLALDFMAEDGRAGGIMRRVNAAFPREMLDLRVALAGRRAPQRILLHHGAEHAGDTRHAHHLQGLPGVELRPLPGHADHGVLLPLLARGLLLPAVCELLELPVSERAATRSPAGPESAG